MSLMLVGLAGFMAGVVATFVGSTAFVYAQFQNGEKAEDL